MLSAVYATPEYVSTLETSKPAAAYVDVDFELQGCPPDAAQLLEVLGAFLEGRAHRGSAPARSAWSARSAATSA